MPHRGKGGFTVIELLITIGIVGGLAAAVLVAVDPPRRFAELRNVRRQKDVRSILDAVKLYVADEFSYPSGLDEDLDMIGTATTGCSSPCGQHLAKATGGG
ncbi:type II secretion system protein [Candidatus Uhrbacteria bacterium]|nr:type II secretion system protein [Candidatus Uhrbacteria bacterium]